MSNRPTGPPDGNFPSDFSKEDIDAMKRYGKMSPRQLAEAIKAIHDEAYALGVMEAKEMTRGKRLGIFNNTTKKS